MEKTGEFGGRVRCAVMLNERPRKTLNWRSPAEAYAEALAVQ